MVRQTLGGRYELLDQLGRGGMAVVWRARDNVLGRAVAVKLLDGPHDTDPLSRQAIRDEARAAAKLSHPNIAQVHDFGESDLDGRLTPYVVMELVPGRTLTQHMMDGPVPPETAFTICAEVAAALAAAHADGLVHRDIKPANVMVTPTGAKVVDFGIAAAISPGGAPGEPVGDLVGTPAYLAPERLTGDAVEPASDVYALGVILYRLLAGHSPWTAETTTRMLAAHIYVEPMPLPALPGVPDQVTELVNRCLSKDPTRRPTARETAAVLARAGGIRLTDHDLLPAPQAGADRPVAAPASGPGAAWPVSPAAGAPGPVSPGVDGSWAGSPDVIGLSSGPPGMGGLSSGPLGAGAGRPVSPGVDRVWPAADAVVGAGDVSPELVAVRRSSPAADTRWAVPNGAEAGWSPGPVRDAGASRVPPGRSDHPGPSGHGPSGHGPSGHGPSGGGPSSGGPSGHGPSGRGASGRGASRPASPGRASRHGRRLFAMGVVVSLVVTAAALTWTLASTGAFPSLAQRRQDMSVTVPPSASQVPSPDPVRTGTGSPPPAGASSPSATRTSEPAAEESDEPERLGAADEQPTRPADRRPTDEAFPPDDAQPPDEEEIPDDPVPVDPPEVVDPEPVVRTFSTRGGSVVAACHPDGSAEILDAEPDGRFKIRDIARGPSSSVAVVFRLALYTERMTVTCADGEPNESVDRSFR